VIYATSDLHGNLLPPPDDAEALLLAGDICPDFITMRGEGLAEQANWLDGPFREWIEGHGLPTVAIWGNHDFVGEHPRIIPDLPWILLQDSETMLHGLRVWGTPWVPRLSRWAFYASDTGLMARAELIPEGLDVLMSHGPPYRAGDRIPGGSKYGNVGAEFVGDSSLNDAIRRMQPKVTICGHIHEARGHHWCSGNRVINVAAVDEFYEVRDEPWTRVVVDE
jgi:Calcineurin-like phosphoesterase